jgi:DNA gyrase subunit A
LTDQTSDELESDGIKPITVEEEMKTSYLDYAMSVIVSRALPDVRDGLKPVHRRILYSMHENGYDHSKAYKKSARIVGDVMGKYHPHGDSAIYDALVRMAQDFSLRLPLIQGQGNFGSMDGDRAAAMRYTEARMAKVSSVILNDIDKDTVDFQANYDESETEPRVLPSRFPNLLVNGASGIAVGMATNIPPHNLGEIIDATCAMLDDPEISTEELGTYVKGPDFPTGAEILGTGGIKSAYATGRGSVIIRSKTHFEEIRPNRNAIIVTEVPFQVNKANLIEKMAELVRDKRIEGISDLRDESDRDGVRVVIELKRDTVPEVVLNQLHRFTQLQTSFGINMLALNHGRPEQMGLKDILGHFIDFREEVITRRTKFELRKARDRAHMLVALSIAVANIDEVVAIIRGAKNPAEARAELLSRKWDAGDVIDYLRLIGEPDDIIKGGKYQLTETQVKAILDLRLHRLTAIGRDEIGEELKELGLKIEELLNILRNRDRLYEILREELVDVRSEFANERRTIISEGDFGDYDDEDLIQREDMVVTVTHSGYIKRVPLSTYRAQRRGGKGRAGMQTKDEDFLTTVFVANTHTPILFFSTNGLAYKMKVWKLPLGSPTSKGKAVINILPLEQGEKIETILPLPEDEKEWENLNVMFATERGNVRRNSMADFASVRANGKIAIRFEEGSEDRLVGVALCGADDNVLLATSKGKAIRFPVEAVRVFKGRTSVGVRGMKLGKGDKIISMTILGYQGVTTEDRDAYLKAAPWKPEPNEPTLDADKMAAMTEAEQFILAVTSNGFGKRTSSYEYRTAGRGGLGIANIDCSDRNGHVVASFPVEESDQIMMVTDMGKIIRTPIHDVRVAGRATQGVTLFKVDDKESIVSVAQMQDTDDDEDDIEGEDGEGETSESVEGDGVGKTAEVSENTESETEAPEDETSETETEADEAPETEEPEE